MQRPIAVAVFGILNIVFAGLGLIGIMSIGVVLNVLDTSNNPAYKVMRESPGYMSWMKLSIPLGLVSCALLLSSGIGLLKMKPWARKVAIGYALYALVLGVVGLVMSLICVVGPLMAQASQQQG